MIKNYFNAGNNTSNENQPMVYSIDLMLIVVDVVANN